MGELKVDLSIHFSCEVGQLCELSVKSLGKPGGDGVSDVIIGVGEVVADVLVDDVVGQPEAVLFGDHLEVRAEKTHTIHPPSHLPLLVFSQDTELALRQQWQVLDGLDEDFALIHHHCLQEVDERIIVIEVVHGVDDFRWLEDLLHDLEALSLRILHPNNLQDLLHSILLDLFELQHEQSPLQISDAQETTAINIYNTHNLILLIEKHARGDSVGDYVNAHEGNAFIGEDEFAKFGDGCRVIDDAGGGAREAAGGEGDGVEADVANAQSRLVFVVKFSQDFLLHVLLLPPLDLKSQHLILARQHHTADLTAILTLILLGLSAELKDCPIGPEFQFVPINVFAIGLYLVVLDGAGKARGGQFAGGEFGLQLLEGLFGGVGQHPRDVGHSAVVKGKEGEGGGHELSVHEQRRQSVRTLLLATLHHKYNNSKYDYTQQVYHPRLPFQSYHF